MNLSVLRQEMLSSSSCQKTVNRTVSTTDRSITQPEWKIGYMKDHAKKLKKGVRVVLSD